MPLKDKFCQKKQICYKLSLLVYLKVWKEGLLKAILLTPRLTDAGSRFSITNISANWRPKLKWLKRLCKEPTLNRFMKKKLINTVQNLCIALSTISFPSHLEASGQPIENQSLIENYVTPTICMYPNIIMQLWKESHYLTFRMFGIILLVLINLTHRNLIYETNEKSSS